MNFVKNFAILTRNKNHIRKSIYLIYKYILAMKMKSLQAICHAFTLFSNFLV